ncbi:hypothetical protein [Serratia ficaria]|uniref:hypothetical protein n=1 Tax=Serratia ficaria TaxID=61651 RepID=UPI000E2618B0|nr:hypothetical protein [Serratia ficaria]REF42106.1 hypothetical protein C7332_0271 [Serratia ficaria]CAI1047742.1 Uncharacterised protein [Serratia ficaria]CAI1103262.1 Uncharacterised protein [Serratia ficaria]CAI1172972.1 Uncharacterised protein [Serratia ficaria]CAI1198174.1 Uncharacterised protein [Serratia ficaria]
MSKHVTESLVFRPASELPTADLDGRAVLVFNPCDGWHDGFVRAREEDGEVYHIGIYPWMGNEMLPHDFYITWALLPDENRLAEKFESEKRHY